ncbi:FxsA family protein [Maritimibacter sp. UBA3975]|uniref:FxsA family protein n=1 Tax=Maritimibacter sp. UBA3975 TaxID=1946833 RepID=UPI000C0A0790|nr:FxsA family protein [Maritimibacter sp. UBA3975]MAM63448.1 exlusion protein FxsA [Maritimibacter sp.]|tara:strand:- start:30326 stop:30820 length:495 start_codon:yes stop_codon:yes gene_type:complete
MWLLLAFIAVPLIEIGLFIQVGGLIGLWPTLLIVLVTAIIGSYMVRAQGAMALGQVRASFNELSDPSEPLAHGAMILFSGALLLTPGFFTDAVGFLLLVPGFRRWAFREIARRVNVQKSFTVHTSGTTQTYRRNDVIDGEYEEVSPPKQPTHEPDRGPSGWTKH